MFRRKGNTNSVDGFAHFDIFGACNHKAIFKNDVVCFWTVGIQIE